MNIWGSDSTDMNINMWDSMETESEWSLNVFQFLIIKSF